VLRARFFRFKRHAEPAAGAQKFIRPGGEAAGVKAVAGATAGSKALILIKGFMRFRGPKALSDSPKRQRSAAMRRAARSRLTASLPCRKIPDGTRSTGSGEIPSGVRRPTAGSPWAKAYRPFHGLRDGSGPSGLEGNRLVRSLSHGSKDDARFTGSQAALDLRFRLMPTPS